MEPLFSIVLTSTIFLNNARLDVVAKFPNEFLPGAEVANDFVGVRTKEIHCLRIHVVLLNAFQISFENFNFNCAWMFYFIVYINYSMYKGKKVP